MGAVKGEAGINPNPPTKAKNPQQLLPQGINTEPCILLAVLYTSYHKSIMDTSKTSTTE